MLAFSLGGMCMSKYEIHAKLCEELTQIYYNKNQDYGDSFAIVRAKVPDAIRVRLWDKMLRLDNLLSGADALVQSETIEDTLKDMANYCLMELIERQLEKEKENAD